MSVSSNNLKNRKFKCEEGDIRFTGISYSTIGRVQMCLNGTWGTICSNDLMIKIPVLCANS